MKISKCLVDYAFRGYAPITTTSLMIDQQSVSSLAILPLKAIITISICLQVESSLHVMLNSLEMNFHLPIRENRCPRTLQQKEIYKKDKSPLFLRYRLCSSYPNGTPARSFTLLNRSIHHLCHQRMSLRYVLRFFSTLLYLLTLELLPSIIMG